MKIAVEGCAHGELDKIYGSLQLLEQRENVKIDLLICCGDFQVFLSQRVVLTTVVYDKAFRNVTTCLYVLQKRFTL
jgi:lariat debranching enzyme